MRKRTIALAIIAKDEVEDVKKICDSYEEYFDSIFVLVDDRVGDFKSVCNSPKINIKKYKRSDKEKEFGGIFFDRKRNTLADMIEEDYYFRLDTDDIIINPENIEKCIDVMDRLNYDILYTNYHYATDEAGNTYVHKRETIVKNNKLSYWNKIIHENLLPSTKQDLKCFDCKFIEIKHVTEPEHSFNSMERNFKYLMYEYNMPGEKDPRTISYIAKSLFGMNRWKEARPFFMEHINTSGWNHDRMFSWCAISDIHRMDNEIEESISAGMEAIRECPNFPDGYLKIGDAYFAKKDYDKCIEWTLMGMSKSLPNTTMVVSMSDYTWKPLANLAFSYFMKSDFKKAYRYIKEAKEFSGEIDLISKYLVEFETAYTQTIFLEHLMWIAKYYEDINPDRVADLVASIPDELEDNEMIMELRSKFLPPVQWDKDTVVIYCPPVVEAWSPASMKNGIGGSEEAVIHIGREFTKLGKKVTVFNDCDKYQGIYDGVEYKKLTSFNRNDKFDTFISWRANVNDVVDAQHKLYWIHDLPNAEFLTKQKVNMTDKIIVLSEYHKSLLPDTVPEHKVFVTTNGINSEDFEGLESIERIPNRIIYASSYDRGLRDILEGWGNVKKEIPDAELHIYYGWNNYDYYLREGIIKDTKFKEEMIELMKQNGVFEHGRIGHKELLKEYCKASYYAYPGNYAGEINCIAITKAIACGVYPITNDFSVLPERNTMGTVATNENFIPSLITALKEGKKIDIDTKKYIEDNSWETVAKDWNDNLIPHKPIVMKHRLFWVYDNIKEGETIVDIGCHDGHTFKGTVFEPNVTHVDLDDFGLDNFVRANAEELPFEDKKFDVAVLAEILEHVPNPVKAISEAMRVAKRVIITVPHEQEWIDAYVPMCSIEDKEKQTGLTRQQLIEQEYKDCKHLTTEDNLEHLWHIRFYEPDTIEEDIVEAGAKDYFITKIRVELWGHIGAIING